MERRTPPKGSAAFKLNAALVSLLTFLLIHAATCATFLLVIGRLRPEPRAGRRKRIRQVFLTGQVASIKRLTSRIEEAAAERDS